MEKRLAIFIVFSLIIIFLYPFFISWMSGTPVNAPLTPQQNMAQKGPEPQHESIHDQKTAASLENQVETETTLDTPISPAQTDAPEVLKVIESDLYRITISNIGGTIRKWELKKYIETNEENGLEEAIQLVPPDTKSFPLALSLPGETIGSYQFDESPLQLSSASPKGVVKMRYTNANGQTITKELRFSNETYLVDLEIATEGYNQPYDLSLGTNFGIFDWGVETGRNAGGVSLTDNEVIKNIPKKMEQNIVTYSGTTRWFGLEDKYYLATLIPRDETLLGPVVFQKAGDLEISSKIRLEPGNGIDVHNFSLYVGPKEYDRLNALNVNLDESIDFGWFIFGSLLPVRMIAKPIFYLLRFFYQFTNNYGISIIMITVLIKVLFFPITQKSMKSMKSMGSIQPKITALRKQYSKDKEKMNAELIKLYKTEKVNPLGGCLPMLLQIPVFISLYNILYTTIELRHAPFFLWVTDLSAKDPYYVLPIIMGGTMFLQQYTAPKTMDSTQTKIMMYLPFVYTFFFLNFPSGLVLYWLVNNSLTIIQQQVIKKDDKQTNPA